MLGRAQQARGYCFCTVGTCNAGWLANEERLAILGFVLDLTQGKVFVTEWDEETVRLAQVIVHEI